MSNIYIILYKDQSCVYEDNAWVDELYFTDKNEAINHLKDNGYKHEQDDIYVLSWNEAEIISLKGQSK